MNIRGNFFRLLIGPLDRPMLAEIDVFSHHSGDKEDVRKDNIKLLLGRLWAVEMIV